MSALAFILELAAIGGAVAVLSAVASRAVYSGLLRLGEVRSPEIALGLLLLPMVVTVGLVSATASPSVLAMIGWGADHCVPHDHHPHLCITHMQALRPWVASVGAVACAVLGYRLSRVALGQLAQAFRLRALVRLGRRSPQGPDVVVIDADRPVCHAAGVLQRRVLVSTSVLRSLAPDEWSAAVAHERAHLARRDPLLRLLAGAAAAFWPQFLVRPLLARFVECAEQAADAQVVRGGVRPEVLASAIVRVAVMDHSDRLEAPALGAAALERRVALLLGGGIRSARPAWTTVVFASCVLCASAVVAALLREPLHHAVESALHHLLG